MERAKRKSSQRRKGTAVKPLVIVFVGEKLAGKEVASHYLVRHHGFVGYRFSKILVDVLGRLYLPVSRVNEMNLVGGSGNGLGAECWLRLLKLK